MQKCNSTIKQRVGYCPLCNDSKEKHLIKGICDAHYWQQVRIKSVAKQVGREEISDIDLQTLVLDADTLFSVYVRKKAAGKDGVLRCYICDVPVHWRSAENMHYIKRGNLFLRWDERNCKAGCHTCNQWKMGNLIKYAEKLEAENNGITEILLEESRLVYKPTRDELKQLTIDLSNKISKLKNS